MTVNCAIIVAISDGCDRSPQPEMGGTQGDVVQKGNDKRVQSSNKNVENIHILTMKWHPNAISSDILQLQWKNI